MFTLFKKDYQTINVNDLPLDRKFPIIDIREISEYKRGHLKTAKNIPMGNLLNNPNKYLKEEEQYYIMCQSGMRSKRTSAALSKAGFKVVNVSGGFGGYVGNKIER